MHNKNDIFHIVLQHDFYSKGDMVSMGDMSFIVVKTFRRTWWRLFLFYTHLMRDMFFINNKERCVILVKKI